MVPYERILAVGWWGAEVRPDATSSELQTPGSAEHWMKLFWPSDLLWSPAAAPADRSPSPNLRPTQQHDDNVYQHYMKLILIFSKDNKGLNWWKVTVKSFIMLEKISVNSNKCCPFELSIHQRILKNTFSGTTVFNIDNNQKCFLSSKSAY